MATTCNLARGSRNATLSVPGQNTYQVEYLAIANSASMGAKAVVEACQLLNAPNDPLPFTYAHYDIGDTEDLGAFCLSFNCSRRMDNQTVWDIVANYGPLPKGSQSGDTNPDPIGRPIKYWLEFETVTEQVLKAYNVNAIGDRVADTLGAIVNAAGIEFDEALFEETSQCILAAQRNYATLEDIYAINATFDRTLNNDTFYGRPKAHAAFRGIESSLVQSDNGTTYYSGTIRVLLSGKPIYRSVLNQGWSHFAAADDTTMVEATNEDPDNPGTMLRVSEPVLLNANGTRLVGSKVGNFIDYRTREFVNYSGLNI